MLWRVQGNQDDKVRLSSVSIAEAHYHGEFDASSPKPPYPVPATIYPKKPELIPAVKHPNWRMHGR